jgi:diketogulonate reductase-like aldo/keto reductase
MMSQSSVSIRGCHVLLVLSFLSAHRHGGMAWNNNNIPNSIDMVNRREALMDMGSVSVWMASSSSLSSTTTSIPILPPIQNDPPPLLKVVSSSTNTINNNNNNIKQPRVIITIPRVGYSLFKTTPEQTERCTLLAILAGVTHFDVATQYSTNTTVAVGCAIRRYLQVGRSGIRQYLATTEKLELLDYMDRTYQQTMERMMSLGGRRNISNDTFSSRRQGLFINYKIANDEQSTNFHIVQQAVQRALEMLNVDYLDMVSIHSPLTDSSRRIATYRSLLEMRQQQQEQAIVKSVGVCNYGLAALQELQQAGLPLPIMNQLELSPFHTHHDVVDYCRKHGIVVGCAAWSRLSSADGPTAGWDVLSKLAQSKGMTKAQILVRWALQKGYTCVPRSASTSKLERMAIAENSYGGVNLSQPKSKTTTTTTASTNFRLSPTEMKILDGLNVNYPAGKLGRKDGWQDSDVTGPGWDPTDII